MIQKEIHQWMKIFKPVFKADCVSTRFHLNAPAETPKWSPRRIWQHCTSLSGEEHPITSSSERDARGSNPLWHRMTSGTLIMQAITALCTHNMTHTSCEISMIYLISNVVVFICKTIWVKINWNYLKPLCVVHYKGIHNAHCNALNLFINCNCNQS